MMPRVLMCGNILLLPAQSRLNSFVKGNVDHMLALRQLTEKTMTAEGRCRAGCCCLSPGGIGHLAYHPSPLHPPVQPRA